MQDVGTGTRARRVLVVVGSRHGGTRGIAETVAAQLRERGLEVTLADAGAEGVDVGGFDAAVVGSAVYVGHWTRPAARFVQDHRDALARRPVWLFSSGPLGDPPRPVEEPGDVADLAASIGARGHEVFPGRLDRDGLSLVERATVRMVHAPYGDFRNAERIRAWASGIADALVGPLAGPLAGERDEGPPPLRTSSSAAAPGAPRG